MFACVVCPLLVEWMQVWRIKGVTLKQICRRALLYSAISLPPLYVLWAYLQHRLDAL